MLFINVRLFPSKRKYKQSSLHLECLKIRTWRDLLPTRLETNASENWRKEDRTKMHNRAETIVVVFILLTDVEALTRRLM